jgi:hypothetical protein
VSRIGRTVVFASAVLALALLGWSAIAAGGSEPNPNTGDSVLGTAGGLRYSSDTANLAPGNNDYGHSTAGCGPDTRSTVGGGAKIAGSPSGSRKIEGTRAYDWYDVDTLPNDGWSASGYGSPVGTISAFAICETGTPVYLVVTEPGSAHQVRSATEYCANPNQHVVGGGVSIATSSSFVSASYPADGADADHRHDDGWSARVLDPVGGAGGMYVDVVCQAGPVSYPTAKGQAGPGHDVSLTVSCPGGSHVSDGGGRITGPGAKVQLESSYPIDGADADSVPDDGWKTIAFNHSASNQTLTAYAVCLG